ncbi:hypothetical protein CEB3_c45500 [Peptococcaceae bacterium CEB3]|nr:hypothetical protein CEB3_c45500 [Peptococcaceae bacterium CEB3]
MKVQSTPRFNRAYNKLPQEIKDLFMDRMHQFKENWRHSSFRVKRVQRTETIWEASLNMSIRFTFEWTKDDQGNTVCLMRNIGEHARCLRPSH